MQSFEENYQQLNTQQRQAVDATDGPVLVIAGPGTGKTQLLSMRVANIIREGNTLADNILCLTFTNKAANNMRVRLGGLVGEPAQRVMIKTFHSFAGELMGLYPDYFWSGARLVNVPDAVQLEIITDILSTLPLDNPLALKFAGQFTATRDVIEALRLAKEAGLTPDKLRALIRLNISYIDVIEPRLVDICSQRLAYNKLDDIAEQLADLTVQEVDELTRPLVSLSTIIQESFATARTLDDGTNKTTNVSKWKTRWIKNVNGQKIMQDERKRNSWWLALADVYESYRNRLHERGYYDYADMIIEVITQLEQNPDMRADVQEQFQYVLIDEFQDTNAAQLRLAHLVADHPAAEGRPNIMVVGDDDQSIYKFNGAELSNILGFTRSYPDTKVIVLTDNYRSSQAVLDISAKVIHAATERISTANQDIQKLLTAQNAPKGKGTIKHTTYPTIDHQYYAVAQAIASLRKQNPEQSVTVLARGHDSLRAIAHALHAQQVPIRYEQQNNVLDQPFVKQVLHVANAVQAIVSGDETATNQHIAAILAHPAWNVSPETFWKLAVMNRRGTSWLDSLLNSQEALLKQFGEWLSWIATESKQQPLPRILEYIIGLQPAVGLTSPLRHYFIDTQTIDTPYVAGLSAIRKLLGLSQEFCKHGQATLADFTRLLQVTEENNRVISDESLFVTAPGAVELLTVYKAKGLEFDTVFIIDCMDNVWQPRAGGRKPPANLPLRPAGDTHDDYIRLLFVAITRAKQNLYVTSYGTDATGGEVLASSIIRDILPAEVIDYADAPDPVEVLESALSLPELSGSNQHQLLKPLVQDYVLSPTAFLNFIDVSKGGPQYFLQRHLLRLPEPQTTNLAFGNAIHSALEEAQKLACKDAFKLSTVLQAYASALSEQYLSPENHARFLDHGQKVLTQLFKTYKLQLQPTGKPEVKINTNLGQFLIGGKLDRLDINESQALITDYKTGGALTNLHTNDKTKQVKAWRHRTQLEFYALLLQESGQLKDKATIHTQMQYVEAETVETLTLHYTPSPEDLHRLQKLIQTTMKKITTLDFPNTSKYNDDLNGIKQFENDLLDGRI